MEDYFSFLPKIDNGIMFIDTNSLEISNQKNKDKRPYLEERLENSHERLSLLTKKLSNMENWVTINEVAEEFKQGIQGLKEIRNKRGSKKSRQIIERAIHIRKRTYKLLNREERNAANHLAEGAAKRIKILLPKAKIIFQRVGGELNERNTDCKLVVHALAFAQDISTYIFSYDNPLLATYAILAKRLGQTIKKTHIINEISKEWENKKTLSSLNYYDWKKLSKYDY